MRRVIHISQPKKYAIFQRSILMLLTSQTSQLEAAATARSHHTIIHIQDDRNHSTPHVKNTKTLSWLGVFRVATLVSIVVFLSSLFTLHYLKKSIFHMHRQHMGGIVFPDPVYSSSDDRIHFVVVGDFGRGNEVQKSVSQAMAEYCEKNVCDFIVGTGDNVYPNGVTSLEDEQFETKFEDMYPQQILKDLDWYMSLGNHDYRGDTRAQIEYSRKSKRWILPDYYYEFKKKSKMGSFDLQFIVTDTIPLNPVFYRDPLINRSSTIFERQKEMPGQMEWLENHLKNHNPRGKNSWTIVIGHNPVYSAGRHYDSQPLIELFEPLFKKYQVPLYLCGHDHVVNWLSNQHISNEKERTQYVISGAGGGHTDKMLKYNPNLMNYYIGDGGFFSVEVQKTFMFIRSFNEKGKEIFKFRIDK